MKKQTIEKDFADILAEMMISAVAAAAAEEAILKNHGGKLSGEERQAVKGELKKAASQRVRDKILEKMAR